MGVLPKLSTPTYYLTVPSTKKKVKFRPFLVKEEKIMMLVKEAKSTAEIVQTMKDVIYACTFEKLDPETLAVFDIEYIFLQLRSKSVGEMIELNMRCINSVENTDESGETTSKECGGTIPFNINIDKIGVEFPEDHSKVVILEEDIGITFKYPTMDTMSTLEDEEVQQDDVEVIVDLIENIFEKDNVYDAKDVKREEMVEFVNNITNKQFQAIRDKFFRTIPTLEHTVKYKCNKCGFAGEYTFRGITDFF